ncbi:hypothetical protein NDU88_008817 [Pleurodeles waltl]|uniref:Uncharacterized protein n=1 Tax=Pleurodeles waltl TaxID=8319 RepID=A0AAV7PU06_PLEWA|nr:hypothetical protein NDU88_008817 [Pleurodeles waltl]
MMGTSCMPKNKVDDIKKDIMSLVRKEKATLGELAKLVGKREGWVLHMEIALYKDTMGSISFGAFLWSGWCAKSWPQGCASVGLTKGITFRELFPIVVACTLLLPDEQLQEACAGSRAEDDPISRQTVGPGRCDLSYLIEHVLAPKIAKRYTAYAETVKKAIGLADFNNPEAAARVAEWFINWAFEQGRSESWAQVHSAAIVRFTKLATRDNLTNSNYVRSAVKGW